MGNKMKFDFEKERDTFLGYCLINAATHKYKGKEFLPQVDGGLEIQFIVNGVELPLHETFKDIEDQIDEAVRKKALELLEDKLSDLESLVYQINEELKKKAKERLNLEIEE
jgi:hypothetical protein